MAPGYPRYATTVIGAHSVPDWYEPLDRLLPMGLSEGVKLKRDVKRDEVLTYADVELPPNRLSDRLRAEQDARFAPPAAPV